METILKGKMKKLLKQIKEHWIISLIIAIFITIIIILVNYFPRVILGIGFVVLVISLMIKGKKGIKTP